MDSRVRRRPLLGALAGSVVFTPWRAALAAEPARSRQALVFGNARYEAAPLRNPRNDARLITTSLRSLGFDVAAYEDLALEPMRQQINTWLSRVSAADVRFFFFAGHGVQFRGRNYMLPVDAELEREEDVLHQAIDIGAVADQLSRQTKGVNLVVLDACRDAPYPLTSFNRVSRSRSLLGTVEPGLSTALPALGTVVAYSTAPGSVAFDGKGGNSAYSKHLAEQLLVPGQPVETMLKRVRGAVARETGNRQVPWYSSSLIGEFCVRPTPSGECSVTAGPARAVNLATR